MHTPGTVFFARWIAGYARTPGALALSLFAGFAALSALLGVACGTNATSEASAGLSGGEPSPCVTASDCPKAPDPRCGVATCEGGFCGLDIIAAPGELVPLDSQIRGDCVTVVCDSTGHSLVLKDGDDVYNDGNPCTLNACENGEPILKPVPDGDPCLDGVDGFCYESTRFECLAWIDGADICSLNLLCSWRVCVPKDCADGFHCGDGCAPCPATYFCDQGSDCQSGVCGDNGRCSAPACDDGVTNGKETGLDCGGSECPICPDHEGCGLPSDCTSQVCWAGICQKPACDDGIKNGKEEGIDCGGVCADCVAP